MLLPCPRMQVPEFFLKCSFLYSSYCLLLHIAGSVAKKSSVKVTLHESQNITHEYVKADAPAEEKMPSIMDLLNARGPVESDTQSQPLPSLMQALNQPQPVLASTMRTARKQPRAYVKQESMCVDDATRSVLSDVLAYNSTDESKNTPPLDFFAAAGVMQVSCDSCWCYV